jgi:hypothetical protein
MMTSPIELTVGFMRPRKMLMRYPAGEMYSPLSQWSTDAIDRFIPFLSRVILEKYNHLI